MGALHDWARRLGGEVSGRASIVCPGPGHSRRDRSLSVRLSAEAPDGFIVHSFAGDDPLVCRDHVRERLGLPLWQRHSKRGPGNPTGANQHGGNVDNINDSSPAREEPAERPTGTSAAAGMRRLQKEAEAGNDRSGTAAILWRRAVPIHGTPGERYLREGRGIRCALPPTMRYLPPRGEHPPTIVTAFAIPDEPEPGVLSMDKVEVRAVHRIRLSPDGRTRTDKRFLGSPAGLPLMVAPWTETGRGLVIAEGIEDALSGHEATGLAAWAGGSAAHMAKLAPLVPEHVESVWIMEDDNEAGRNATRTLAAELRGRNVEVIILGGTRG